MDIVHAVLPYLGLVERLWLENACPVQLSPSEIYLSAECLCKAISSQYKE